MGVELSLVRSKFGDALCSRLSGVSLWPL